MVSFPDLKDQERLIKQLYKIVNIPIIRNRLQTKLIPIVIDQTNEEKINKLLQLVQPKAIWQCSSCLKVFNSEQAYLQHRKDTHDTASKKPIQCPKCARSFSNMQALTQHLQAKHNRDSTLSTYLCKLCNKKFANDQALLNHQQSKHHLIPSKTKSYICKVCSKSFETQNGLDLHQKMKH